MRQKLKLFKAMGYENSYSTKIPSLEINNMNHKQMANITNISFEDVKQTISNMLVLKKEEIQEILEKIDELENIISSTDRKAQKRDHVKDIIK